MSAPQTITVNAKNLPLSCPPVGTSLWNLHPRVFLAADKDGVCRCPYCGAHYRVQGDAGGH